VFHRGFRASSIALEIEFEWHDKVVTGVFRVVTAFVTAQTMLKSLIGNICDGVTDERGVGVTVYRRVGVKGQ
jgi:hypothetical protein